MSLVVVVTTDGSEYQYLRDFCGEPFSVITTKSSRNSKSGFSKETTQQEIHSNHILQNLVEKFPSPWPLQLYFFEQR